MAMKVLITGGAGFAGTRLARTLLARGRLDGRPIDPLVIADQAQAPAEADLLADPRVQGRVGQLLVHCQGLREEAFDSVFHLASAVSGECEADFELGLHSNLDSTRALLDALRRRNEQGTAAAKLVFSSSVAVFGPDPALPRLGVDGIVADDTLPTPQTSYGTHKLICEHLVADNTRKGYIDGCAARLMTVTVRPGRPNGAASSFFSGIIREPLAGLTAVCPVSADVSHPVTSVQRTVDGLIAGHEASREAFCGRTALNLPALNVSVQQMLNALEAVAGPAVRAARLGLQPEPDFHSIIRQYIDDCRAGMPQALKGL